MDDFTKEDMNEEFFLSDLNDFRYLFSGASESAYDEDGNAYGEDDASGGTFLCPFCSQPWEFFSLSSHIESEHCFSSKPTICPICNDSISSNVFRHFTTHHKHIFKGHGHTHGHSHSQSRHQKMKAVASSQAFSAARRSNMATLSNENNMFPHCGDAYRPNGFRSLSASLASFRSGRASRLNFTPGSTMHHHPSHYSSDPFLNSKSSAPNLDLSFDFGMNFERSELHNSERDFPKPPVAFDSYVEKTNDTMSLDENRLTNDNVHRDHGENTLTGKDKDERRFGSLLKSSFVQQIVLSTIFDEI